MMDSSGPLKKINLRYRFPPYAANHGWHVSCVDPGIAAFSSIIWRTDSGSKLGNFLILHMNNNALAIMLHNLLIYQSINMFVCSTICWINNLSRYLYSPQFVDLPIYLYVSSSTIGWINNLSRCLYSPQFIELTIYLDDSMLHNLLN